MQYHKEIVQYLVDFEIRNVIGSFNNYSLPSNFESDKSFRQLLLILKSIISHNHAEILNTDLSIFGLNCNVCFDADLKETFSYSFTEEISVDNEKLQIYVEQLILLFIGVAALQQFVRANISGPEVSDSECYKICSSLLPDEKISDSHNLYKISDSDKTVIQFLKRNGELPFGAVAQPKLLYLSILFLSQGKKDEDVTASRKWWWSRCQMIHQRIIPERIASFHDEMVSLHSDIAKMDWMREDSPLLPRVVFSIECAQMHLHYHEVAAAKRCVEAAQKMVGLDIKLSGAYGKKTQFQQKAVAQLYVKLERTTDPSPDPESSGTTADSSEFPPDLLLGNDTLLNKVHFVDDCENAVHGLLPAEQVVLLAHCSLALKGEAYDELLSEEVTAYVSCLLEQPRSWAVYLKALTMRCRLEKKSSRRVERALMQLEAVIAATRKDSPPFSVREPFLYASALPALWDLEKELADLWMSLGGTNSALAIYERLGSWQEMILCYQLLGRGACAEKLIRQRLRSDETPVLWCLLGDVTGDTDMYVRAYELSGGTSARSQRSLAYHHYKRRDYSASLPFFNRSLEINPLQSELWFCLGFSALQCEDYPLAIKAFRQVVTLDQDHFEAWNNLANAHIKVGQKERAWRCLSEALKCNYEEWRVWENFLVVSVDVGAFEDAFRAWHRLIDIRGKHADPDVARILVRAINEDIPDFSGAPSSRLRKSALQLFGRASSASPSDYVIWDCYASLQCPDASAETDGDALRRSVEHQQKAVLCCTKSEAWQSDFSLCREVLLVAQRFADLSLALLQKREGDGRRQKSSSKLALQGVVLRAQKCLDNFQSEQKCELEKLIDAVKHSQERILSV